MYPQENIITQYLSRDEVPNYISCKFGDAACVNSRTLAKMAVTGGGPEYVKFGRRVAYSPEKIDQWVQKRAQPMASTSAPVKSGWVA